jgi:penicillin-binding protein 2
VRHLKHGLLLRYVTSHVSSSQVAVAVIVEHGGGGGAAAAPLAKAVIEKYIEVKNLSKNGSARRKDNKTGME